MAASELIQELIRAHLERNDQRFRTVALQLAALPNESAIDVASAYSTVVDEPSPFVTLVIRSDGVASSKPVTVSSSARASIRTALA
jgi:hypothetical protein